jgi:hypothetical protein
MITLKDECKNVGITVNDLSVILDVPYQTLNDWSKTRCVLLTVVFEGIRARMLIEQLKDFNVITTPKNESINSVIGICATCGDDLFDDDLKGHGSCIKCLEEFNGV